VPSSERKSRPLTTAVHGGEARHRPLDALAEPIVQTATYTFRNTQALVEYMEGRTVREEYGRYGNPTVRTAELKMAALEGTEDALGFASGMAAVTTALMALINKSNAHVVLFDDC
jgi:cystathionine gamma-synthase